MKSALILTTAIALLVTDVRGDAVELGVRATDGYVQNPSGTASFTYYSGCSSPGKQLRVVLPQSTHADFWATAACGESVTGYSAAMSQLAFGSEPGLGAGDACGRCFKVTANKDPYSPSYTGPFNSIVVKATNLCPVSGNGQWCGQTTADPVNSFGMAVQ